MRERQGIFNNIDFVLFFAWFILGVAGCFAIFSASSHGNWLQFFDFGQRHMRQLIFLGLSVLLLLIVFSFDYQFIVQSSPFFYVFTVALLLLTLFIGSEINGSKSWIRMGSFQIQPAEFAKTGTSLMLAYWLGSLDRPFKTFRSTALVLLILALPMSFILLQGDTGSMLTFSMLIFVLYREGFTPVPIYLGLVAIALTLCTLVFGWVYVSVGVVLLAGILLFVYRRQLRNLWQPLLISVLLSVLFSFSVTTMFNNVLKDYQKDRVLVILGLKEDLHGAGYNLWQSKMAVSSGRITGKGYLQGVQTQNEFVPEVSTDYIFSSIGEEFGFLGSLFVIGMFALLIFRILYLAERQRSDFSRIFMYCASCFFIIHVFINIGMVIGVFPTAGIPLPFFSYGGSSLLSFTLIIALVLRLDAERLYMLS